MKHSPWNNTAAEISASHQTQNSEAAASPKRITAARSPARGHAYSPLLGVFPCSPNTTAYFCGFQAKSRGRYRPTTPARFICTDRLLWCSFRADTDRILSARLLHIGRSLRGSFSASPKKSWLQRGLPAVFASHEKSEVAAQPYWGLSSSADTDWPLWCSFCADTNQTLSGSLLQVSRRCELQLLRAA